ncbi:IS3 family transposase [Novipirellula artificiosorum]|uniref:Integrase core domain protein n=1 Tax=Novipirellula artificiosorum TaxID=2528016 RepID=A0A5C6D8X7_9BACT|nr:IS3 family transposase [Novipirellula artificiosorum]TWU31309.1 Integrase core domain protein [Novipirellula artificiosorum]
MIEPDHADLSIRRQCEILGLSRSTYYSEPAQESPENLRLMRMIDEQHLEHPHMGRLSMTQWLNLQGYHVNIKRVRRLMDLMDLTAIYPKPRMTIPNKEHVIYPYLLRGIQIERPDQVWSTDITYLPMYRGFMYLVAVIDWYSRHVLSWRVSNSLENSFCIDALEEAFATTQRQPEIFNTDQGAQFTSQSFTSILKSKEIQISMDGKGRALDNVFIERLWRSLKYEAIYLKEDETVADLINSVKGYFEFYSLQRPHQALGGQTPMSVYGQAA